jgi:hypothetical protein
MCAASVAALRGILPESRMVDANSATSGVMSSSGRCWTAFNLSRVAAGSPPRFIDDELRDEKLESALSCLPPISGDLLMGRNDQIAARPRGQVARNSGLQVQERLHSSMLAGLSASLSAVRGGVGRRNPGDAAHSPATAGLLSLAQYSDGFFYARTASYGRGSE